MQRICFILSDFGIQDNYIGVMKGILYSIAPECKIVDICNSIPPGDIKKAHFQLFTAFDYLPPAVFLVVVDPGVGSERRSIVVEYKDSFFIGPDNGVFTYFIQSGGKVHEITEYAYLGVNVSNTFHGRDIYARAAAILLKGSSLTEISSPLPSDKPALTFDFSFPLVINGKIAGEIIYIDCFGNLISNITGNSIQYYLSQNNVKSILFKDIELASLSGYYAEKKEGQPGIIIGSSGFLEIFVNMGNAQNTFEAKVGDKITVYLE